MFFINSNSSNNMLKAVTRCFPARPCSCVPFLRVTASKVIECPSASIETSVSITTTLTTSAESTNLKREGNCAKLIGCSNPKKIGLENIEKGDNYELC